MMKYLLQAATAFFVGSQAVSAQTDQVVDDLNKGVAWRLQVSWLENDQQTQEYLERKGGFDLMTLQRTLEQMDKDRQQAQALLTARQEIAGKGSAKKQRSRLARRFTDVVAALSVFEKAEGVLRRSEMLGSAIRSEIRARDAAVMPSGRLMHFSYYRGNGFAGWSERITLDRKKKEEGTGGWLKIEEERRFRPDEVEKQMPAVEVEDSVLDRVRELAERGELYKEKDYYSPEYDITDGTSWSMSFSFESRGSIRSGGYMEGPDHPDALRTLTAYLREVYGALQGIEPNQLQE